MVHAHDDLMHIPIQDHEETYYEKRVIAVCNLLMDKGIITAQELLDVLQEGEARDPSIGAGVVAHAWVDADFKQRLLKNGKEALGEIGVPVIKRIKNIQVAENTESVHHLAVCTLCSCYPVSLLGIAPEWYKSDAYRTRAIREPRAVLKEFGLDLDEKMEVRVVDATSDIRYLILPRRPKGTEDMSEEELAALVTRDSMIGAGEALSPSR